MFGIKRRSMGGIRHGHGGSSFSLHFGAETRETGPLDARPSGLYGFSTAFEAWGTVMTPPLVEADVRSQTVPETQIKKHDTSSRLDALAIGLDHENVHLGAL